METVWDEIKEQAYESVGNVRLKGEKHTHSDTYRRGRDNNEERQRERGIKEEKTCNKGWFQNLPFFHCQQ